jgi:general secretion pathway protein J
MTARHARSPIAGFTLLEITVALAIFAVLSTLAYGGLRQILDARRDTERAAERLAALQTAMYRLAADLEQAAPRPVRSEYGDSQQPLVGSGSGGTIELTSASWRNPAGLPRSTLRRVGYEIQGGVLTRLTWPVLDRSTDTRPEPEELLDHVLQLGFRFLDDRREWHADWPPGARQGEEASLPLAVEVTLELEDWGLVHRLVRLPG